VDRFVERTGIIVGIDPLGWKKSYEAVGEGGYALFVLSGGF
jgi:hypothetical protein